jgi:hypothetical protein
MLFLPTIGAKLSGSLGGITASRGRGGGYFRSRVVPTNPGSAAQGVVREIFATLSVRWKGDLTPEQRDAWDAFATNSPLPNRIGEIKAIPGLAWYQKANAIRALTKRAIADDPPAVTGIGVLSSPTDLLAEPSNDLGFSIINTDTWAGAVGGALAVFASPPQNPGRKFYKGPFRFCGQVNGAATPPTSAQSVTLPFAVVVGQKIFVRFVATEAGGNPTNESILEVIVT